MADQDGIDPRHDPIYQRGYDPAVHGEPARTAAPTRRSRSRHPADVDLYAPPGFGDGRGGESSPGAGRARRTAAPIDEDHGSDGGVVVPAPPPPALHSAEPDGEPAAAAPRATIADDRPGPVAAVPPWRNPYLVGLVIGGAVLALVGFQMFRSALESIYVDFAESGFFFGGSSSSTEEPPDITGELVSMQLGWSIGPLLVLVGVAAILAAVVFVAVRWRPVVPPAEPSAVAEDRP